MRDKTGDQTRIHLIGLAPLTHGLRIMAHILGIQQKHGEAVGMGQIGELFVIAARGFEAEAATRGHRVEPSESCVLLVGEGLHRPGAFGTGDNDLGFGDIDTAVQNG